MPIHFKINNQTFLGDMISPIQLYLKLRKKFPNSLLLESSDYHSQSDSYSFICLNPIANFILSKGKVSQDILGKKKNYAVTQSNFLEGFNSFKNSIKIEEESDFKTNGFFGYISWDAIPYFEDIEFSKSNNPASIPEIQFAFYQNIIVFNHYHNTVSFIEYTHEKLISRTDEIKKIINKNTIDLFPFKSKGKEKSNLTDDAFIKIIKACKKACFRGDVFQIVPSRQFSHEFEGDDFQVYRALRSINPSPYLFYFDYGDFHIMGSSPESQIVIKNNTAHINPIAGTFKRLGDTEKDKALAEKLKADPKENAEHVMLVDLARNDLSRNSSQVQVETYKDIQYFSHVIHMVSKVSGTLANQKESLKVFGDSFPAGTLSGAPKYKALQLIDKQENQNRGIYGGAIGFLGLNGDINMAIAIRSFVSKNNVLYSQAGAGIVSKSDEYSELKEVNHKLEALKKAISRAEKNSENF